MYSSSAATRLLDRRNANIALVSFQRLQRAANHQRRVVSRKLVHVQQFPDFHLHQFQKLFVVDHVRLIHVHDDLRYTNLTRQQNVLTRLRHRAVRRAHHQDRAVHLRRTRDHVLHIVRVSRAVNVRVVPRLRLIFHVARRNRDAALPLFRRIVDLIEIPYLATVHLRTHLRQRRRQRRLAMIHVSDRTHIHVWLRTFKFLFGHLDHSSF